MYSRNSSSVAAAAVAVVICLLLTTVLAVAPSSDHPETFTTGTSHTGRSLHIDATQSDFIERGYVYGDQVILKFSGKAPVYALFCDNRNTVGYYETYVCFSEREKCMVIGQQFGGLDSSYNGPVQISFVKHTDRTSHLDNFLKGNINYSESKSDDTFCNFREVTVGDIKPGIVYRSCDPLGGNMDTRHVFADQYAEQVQVAHEINLCDNAETVQRMIDDGTLTSTYCKGLLDNGDVLLEQMSLALFDNTEQFKVCLTYMIENDGSFLIHCAGGKDRTGLYFILLEGICGGSMKEISEDYMLSMVNYYNIEYGSDEYYTVQHMMFDRIVYFIAHTSEFENRNSMDWTGISISDVDINAVCTSYILNEVGLSQEQLDQLVSKLTN